VICAQGKSLCETNIRVYGKVFTSPGLIPPTPPSDAGSSEIDPVTCEFLIPELGGVTFGSGVRLWCALWVEGWTSGGTAGITNRIEIPFTPVEHDTTECEDGSDFRRRFAATAAGEAFPATYLVRGCCETRPTDLAVRPVPLHSSGVAGLARDAYRWLSEGDVDWRLDVSAEGERLLGVLTLEGVLGVRLSRPLSWRSADWRPLGSNRLDFDGPTPSGQFPRVLVVHPA
jgi:hypothetical protein